MKTAETSATIQLHCQTFRQGCVGCCVNMRWKPSRVLKYLEANTAAAETLFPQGGRPGRRELARMHRMRGGWLDFALAVLLVMPTFGLSAFLWRRYWGSCCFAGYLNRADGRVGCLVHPARAGGPDLRRLAFPWAPTLGCDRTLRCPMLADPDANPVWGAITASREGYRILHR